MKRILALLFVGGFAAASFATDARIIGLGRQDAFFMDDYSIFRNPANVNIYPNMLIGALGFRGSAESTGNAQDDQLAALKRENRDPIRPYVGGVLSYSFNQSTEAGSQYPMLSFGVVANRHDQMLDYLVPGNSKFNAAYGLTEASEAAKTAFSDSLPLPVGKFDVMAGYAFKDGGMIGAGGYFAFQKGGEVDSLETSLYKGTLGINWPIAKSTDLEASVGVGALTAIGYDQGKRVELAEFAEDKNFAFNGDVRLFSALTMINGDFVPHLGVNMVNLQKYSFLQVALGLGVNVNVDKGFGWGGLEFIHEQSDFAETNEVARGTGARLSLGFERNLWVDYFLLRGGICKKLLFVTDDEGENGKWNETTESDASDEDMVGVGFGLNVENRLKIDVVVAEDLFYTLTNLVSGPQDHLFTRLTFTYSF